MRVAGLQAYLPLHDLRADPERGGRLDCATRAVAASGRGEFLAAGSGKSVCTCVVAKMLRSAASNSIRQRWMCSVMAGSTRQPRHVCVSGCLKDTNCVCAHTGGKSCMFCRRFLTVLHSMHALCVRQKCHRRHMGALPCMIHLQQLTSTSNLTIAHSDPSLPPPLPHPVPHNTTLLHLQWPAVSTWYIQPILHAYLWPFVHALTRAFPLLLHRTLPLNSNWCAAVASNRHLVHPAHPHGSAGRQLHRISAPAHTAAALPTLNAAVRSACLHGCVCDCLSDGAEAACWAHGFCAALLCAQHVPEVGLVVIGY